MSETEERHTCGNNQTGYIKTDFDAGIGNLCDVCGFPRKQIGWDDRQFAAVWQRNSKTDDKLILEINRIGNNLNQIARAVNKQERINVLSELVKIEQSIKELVNGS